MPRVGFAAFAASARAKAEPAAAPKEADAQPKEDEQPKVPAAVAAAAAAAVSGRPRGKDLSVEEVKSLLESLRTASMRPEFQKELAQLRNQDWGAFKKRQAFAKILARAWKASMRTAGFGIDKQGFPQLLATVRGNQPDVRTLSEEVERHLKFPAGALFGAKAGQMKGSATATAAKGGRGAFSSIAGSAKEEEQAAAPPQEKEPPSVRGRALGMGEAKEMLKAFKDIANQKDVQKTLSNLDRQGPEHIAKSMPFLISQLFSSTMEMFDYPNSAEGYAEMVRGIKKHGWNLHVKTAAHEVERLMHMRLGSWFSIPADEGEEEAARALNAANGVTNKPQQLEPKAGEMLLVIKHAVENKQIKVVLPESACFADAKEAISKRTGRNDIMTRGRLVQKRGGTYSSYRDSDPIGALRELLVLGADLSIEGEEPEEEEEQAAPPVHPYAQQQQQQQQAGNAGWEPPPPQRQEPPPPPKPPPDPVPTLTKQQALNLQNDLKHGFRGEAFQRRRRELEKAASEGLKPMKFNAERNKLFLSVQSTVLPKYGFRGDAKGVFDMMKAFENFNGDEDIATNGYEINVLLGLAEPPQPPQPQPPPPQQPAPPPPPPPQPQPQPPPPKPQPPPPPPQPEKPPEEVTVTVEHALEGGSLTVTIMDNATMMELRKLVMAKLNETKVSQVKIVSRLGDGYQSVPDDRKVKDKRAFLMIGRSIDLPKEPEPAPVPAAKAKAKEPEREMELTVVIDENLGLKTSLKVKPGTSLAAVKELLAAADASGGTQAHSIGLRLPGSDAPLEDGYQVDSGTTELHYCGQASSGEHVNISGQWKMVDAQGKEGAQFVLIHEQNDGTEVLKGWQVGALEIWDGKVSGDHVEWKVGGCLIAGKLKDQRWRMAELMCKTEEGWDVGPFTGEWVCTVEEAVAAAQQGEQQGGGEDIEVTVFIDRSLDLKTSLTVKHNSTIWNIKELIAGDDPTGKTQPQDFGLRGTDGVELGDGVCIAAARELEIMMKA